MISFQTYMLAKAAALKLAQMPPIAPTQDEMRALYEVVPQLMAFCQNALK